MKQILRREHVVSRERGLGISPPNKQQRDTSVGSKDSKESRNSRPLVIWVQMSLSYVYVP